MGATLCPPRNSTNNVTTSPWLKPRPRWATPTDGAAAGTRRELRDGSRYRQYADHLDAEALRGFYRDMALIRRFDQEATALQRQGQLLLWAPLRARKRAQIGSGRAASPRTTSSPPTASTASR